MIRPAVLILCLTMPPSARACDIALLLAIDVSGSVDAGEFRLQVDGTADALADPAVADALVAASASLSIVQWSGTGMQQVVLPWTTVASLADAARLSDTARALPRVYDGSDTAVGDAIAFSAATFDAVAGCRRQVIDISGDGPQNAGLPLAASRGDALARGIGINAIAIEDIGVSLTEFYRRLVISENGFVVTARGHLDYPRAIRMKLLREIEQPAF
jgi:Ca-activated chloride channel homolog